MARLQNQFTEFHDQIKMDHNNELRRKRDILEADIREKLPEKLSEKDIDNISIEKFIDQGSYKIKTTIKPSNDVYDRDVAVILNLDPLVHDDPVEIKKLIRDCLLIENVRIPKIKEPCVTVAYMEGGEEKYHIDFPIYAQDPLGEAFLARGKEYSNEEYRTWESADPEGLNEYLLDKLSGDDGQQLRRVIRYLKKWKSERYKNSDNDHEIPPSIGLTLLACELFVPEYVDSQHYDLLAFYHVVDRALGRFTVGRDADREIVSADITHLLPVKPYSDTFVKMKNSDGTNPHVVLFYKRMKRLRLALENAIASEFDHESAKYLAKELGDEFPIPSEKESSQRAQLPTPKREDSFA